MSFDLVERAREPEELVVCERRPTIDHVGTDERATHAFGRHWFVIGWASGAIRRRWLNALHRKIAGR